MEIKKFLEFNGKTIYFLSKDGVYWIAIKPICDALEVDYNRQFQNLKDHPTYSQLFAIQQMVGADNRIRKMVALPERYIYGWLSNIRSKSPELIKYQLLCCDILYTYLHGSITYRETLIRQKAKELLNIERRQTALSNNTEFQEIQNSIKAVRRINSQLRELDNSLQKDQLDLFNNG